MKRLFIFQLLAIVLLLSFAIAAVAQGPIEPPSVNTELGPGESIVVTKTITTSEIPSTSDIYFLADTTGSMGTIINAVKTGASGLISTISGLAPDAVFGAGDYKDFPYDTYAFMNAAPITDDGGTAALAAISGWSASGGSDGDEGQFYALDQLAESDMWRTGSTKIVVWFGDAPGHDPICSAISGLGYDIDEASLTAKLVAAGIHVIAISTVTGYPDGLDDDPTTSFDYTSYCGDPGGTSGQGSRIAAATGGVYMAGIDQEAIIDAILDALSQLSTDVWPTVVADPGLIITFDPEVHEDVPSGDTVTFDETIAVDPGAECGVDLTATVTFWANSYPAEGAALGTQEITVTVPCNEGCLDIDKTVDFDGDGVFTDLETNYAGNDADWAIRVTNCGDSDIHDIYVSDDNNGADFYGPFDLAAGAYLDIPVYTTNPMADLENEACAEGLDELDNPVGPVCDTAAVEIIAVVGTEGCSLGYWKNHPGCWECYDPDMPFSEVFDRVISVGKGKKAADDPTLMEALNGNGGGVTALARQAVAALLNACDPDIDYPLTEGEIVDGVYDILSDGASKSEISEAAGYLDYFNNLGCPQNAHCEPTDYDDKMNWD